MMVINFIREVVGKAEGENDGAVEVYSTK